MAKSNEPEKITIHVSKDGRYQKTVERVSSNSGLPTTNNLKAPPRKRWLPLFLNIFGDIINKSMRAQ